MVTDYLNESGLSEDLNALGFDLVGYGCTTCIGNSGPLPEPISKAINENDLVAVSVLSGNRNFEGRVSPDCRANYLASPPLVVAYALKGTVRSDMVNEPIGTGIERRAGLPQGHLADQRGNPLADRRARPFRDVPPPLCRRLSAATSAGGRSRSPAATTYGWPAGSTYIQNPPYFDRHDDDSRRRRPTSSGRGRWRSSAIRSPPTTSRPPARSSPTARPAAICSSIRSAAASSTATARAAATTK